MVVDLLEPLEALHTDVVEISSIGDKTGRRSVGSRHFEWRMGQQWKGQRLMLLLGAYPKHTLLWSSFPSVQSCLPQPDLP